MLDHPEKTKRLFVALKVEAPFEVELAPSLLGEQMGGHGVRLGVLCVQRKCLSDACHGSTQRVVERLLA